MNNGSESTSIILGRSNGNGRDLSPANANFLNTPLDGGTTPTPHAGGELHRLQQMMRGRWHWAIGLAVVGALTGGGLGFAAGHKIYVSVAQMRVVPVVPTVIYGLPEKGVPEMFDDFVETQVALLKSPTVMDLATQDPAWQAVGGSPTEQAAHALLGAMDVTRSGELITIKVSELDPAVAAAAAKSIVRAFNQAYEAGDAESSEKRLIVLQNMQASKGNELAAIREQIRNIGQPFGTDDLRPLFAIKQSALVKLDGQIADAEDDLTAAARGKAGNHIPEQMSPEDWAMFSPELAALIKDRDNELHQIKVMEAEKLGQQNQSILTARAIVDSDQKEIDAMAGRLKARRDAGLLHFPDPGAAGNQANHFPADPDTLREELENLKKRRDAARADMLSVGEQQRKIQDLKDKEDQVVADRNAAQERINQLNTEATINGRISVISYGEVPAGPARDTRILFAAAGILGGGFLGLAAILGLAAFDRRLRSPDETEATGPGLLGLLPRLPDDLADSAEAARAAHCVTGVRNLLQLWSRGGDRRAFVVTSPVPGAGKTSLTLALGVSYATSRQKTLMIDCDLIGAGLTGRADKIITRKLGQLLLREGLLTEHQLAEALAVSRDRAARLGEVVVEHGWATQAVIDRLLLAQGHDTVGLLDAVDGTPLSQCVTDTGIPNLTILPVGSATSRDVALLSAEALHRLIDSAKSAYDIVLIDTGPIPGSLEAQLAAAVADGVIVVVSPGVMRPLIRRCMERLKEVGGHVAGLVYNRASDHDVFVYTSGSQPRDMPSIDSRLSADPTAPPSAQKLGPLASAVSRSAPGGKADPSQTPPPITPTAGRSKSS